MQNPAQPYRSLLLVCCAVCFGCYSGAYMRIPVLPLFVRSFGADTFQIGIIASSFMLTAGGFCLPLGILSDRVGRLRLILAGLLVSALSSLCLGFCGSAWQVMCVYLFSGAGLAAFAPTMMSFVTDFSPRTHLGRSYGWYTMAMYGGMSLGPAMGGFAGQLFGFAWVFIISGCFIFVMFWIAFLFLPQTAARPVHRRSDRSSGLIIRELVKNGRLMACWMVTLGSCFGLGVFVTFMPLHASDQGIGMGKIGAIFGTQALVNALGRIPFGHLSDRVADRTMLVVGGLLGYSLAIAGIGLSSTLPLFLCSAFAMGISMGIAFTAVGALIAEVVPADSRGLAMGGYNTCIYLGMMLSALIMGMVTREIGFRTGFLITASINALATLAFGIIFKATAMKKSVMPGN